MGSGLRRNDGCLSRYVRGAVRHTGAGRYPGAGDGFRPPPERRLPKPERRAGPSVIPAQAGIEGWGMGSGLRRNDGCLSRNDERGRPAYRRRPVSRGPGDGFRPPPERRAGPSGIPAQAGIQGAGDGFRPAPERRLPKPVRKGGRPSYRRRPVSRGGGWVPASAGTTAA